MSLLYSINGSVDVNPSGTNKSMMERGNIAMGFDQNKISHKFVPTPFGGIIITALNSSDKQTIDQIKNHILDIQKEFLKVTLPNHSLFMHKRCQELRSCQRKKI
ncbi:MAG: hypothetical protein ABJB76_02150 [Candidatus Nitrosocosmicus sp.]